MSSSSRSSSSTSSSSSSSSIMVHFVEEDDDGGHFYLTRQQDVLARLGHGAVGSRHNQDSAVHLGGTGDHVFDVVPVTGQSTWA